MDPNSPILLTDRWFSSVVFLRCRGPVIRWQEACFLMWRPQKPGVAQLRFCAAQDFSAFLPAGKSEEHNTVAVLLRPNSAIGGIVSRQLHSLNPDPNVDRCSVRVRGVACQKGRDVCTSQVFCLSSDQRSGSLSVPIARPISSADVLPPNHPQPPLGVSISKGVDARQLGGRNCLPTHRPRTRRRRAP